MEFKLIFIINCIDMLTLIVTTPRAYTLGAERSGDE